MIKVFFTEIKELPDQQTEQIKLHELNLIFQQQLLQIKDRKKRLLSLAGKLLLQKMIDFFSLQVDLNEIKYTKNHKPFLNSSFNFNVSYSNEIVVCAATLQSEIGIGIDVEKVVPIELDLYEMYFTSKEWNDIVCGKDYYQFYEYWTRKEALLKAVGKGVSNEMSSIEVIPDTVLYESKSYFLQKVLLTDEYVCHVACSNNDKVEVSEVNIF